MKSDEQVVEYYNDISSALGQLYTYSFTHAVSDLRAAADDLGHVSVDRVNAANNVSTRRALVKAWATWFQTFDTVYDPSYDPSDPKERFFWHVPPPQGYAPNVSPSDISDPHVRAEYEQRIDANTEIMERSAMQSDLRSVQESAFAYMRTSLYNLRVESPPDDEALRTIIDEANLHKARAAQLEKLLSQ